ncbi:SSI family serine proteinase inhibitor [Streptomyces sp. CC208A]|uniref:SSI family serine proteinase inhibitor n=1 Tax=Streptomyces sp. CC208A TaxID=3044573 RepID=UPI0024A8BB06|nr:SSI family serine proteinase inhibitor [Streptomyces sp. CC208A]
MLLRSLVLATALAGTAAGVASAVPLPPLPGLPLLSSPQASPDALTVEVSGSGHPEADGRWELRCGEGAGGDHPAAARACERLAGFARAGEDPFAPVAADRFCAQVYGGAVTAQVTGVWQGRRVDARFSRANGCEIERWENAEPLLPSVRG